MRGREGAWGERDGGREGAWGERDGGREGAWGERDGGREHEVRGRGEGGMEGA